MDLTKPGRLEVGLPQPTRTKVAEAIRVAVSHVTGQLQRANSLERRVRGEEWSVADAAAHLAITQEVFAEIAAGGSHPYAGHEPTTYAEVNARLLRDMTARQPAEVCDAIQRHTDAFIGAIGDATPGAQYDTPLGPMPVDALVSYNLAHLLQHGHSISSALGAASPLHPRHTYLTVPFLQVATPFAYRMSTRSRIDATVDVRLVGQFRFAIRFRRDRAEVGAPAARAECHLAVRPVAFLLIMLGQADPLGMVLRGQTFAWGRHPWLALQMKDYLPGL